jgi:hypothetical protein
MDYKCFPTKTKSELLAEITSIDALLKGKITEKHTTAGKENGSHAPPRKNRKRFLKTCIWRDFHNIVA